jgi:hypothetical protein
MSIFTTWLADDVLGAYFDAGTPSDPANCYAGLLETVTAGEAGTVGETAYTGYARVQLDGKFAAIAAGLGGRSITTNAAVTFGQKSDAGTDTMIALGIYDSLTGGNLMAIVYLDGGDPVPFTALNAGDVFTAVGHPFVDDDRCRLEDIGGALIPTGVTVDATYWIITTSGETFQLSLTQGGGAITLSADGGGMVMPLTPKDVTQDDTPEFASGAIEIGLD